jgi:hypothetical protein
MANRSHEDKLDAQDERDVAAWMQELAALPLDTSPTTDPVYLWWKAEMLRRWDAQRRVVAPIDIGEHVVAGIALFAALALLRWLWDQLSASSGTIPVGAASIAWATMIGIFILLAGAAFFAFRNIFHSEVSS